MSKTSKLVIAIIALALIAFVVMYSMRTKTVAVSNSNSDADHPTYQVTDGGPVTFAAPAGSVPAGVSPKLAAGSHANGDVSVLTAHAWVWKQTLMAGAAPAVPTKPASFVLTFATDGHVSSTTDCNALAGTYTVVDGGLTFGPLASTQMYCDGSQESGYTQNLAAVTAYSIDGSGDLVFALGGNQGTMVFTKRQ